MKENQNNIYLCLVDSAKDYEIIGGVDIYSIYCEHNKILRAIRYWHHKFFPKLITKKIWLGKWKHKLKQYNQIVVFDSMFDYYPLEYIRTINPDCKIHYCFRNRVKSPIEHSSIDKNPDYIRDTFKSDVYSYNIDDCKTYSLRYYPQFHIIPQIIVDSKCDIKRDVYFIGNDKGRIDNIRNLAEIFEQEGIIYLFEIVPDRNKKYLKSDTKFIVNSKKYCDVLHLCKESKCILDIVGEVNYGMTYRVVESIILKKKLITNYTKIIDSELYDPNNMFVLGYNKDSELIEFIHKPYFMRHEASKIQSFKDFISNILILEQ